MSQEPAHSPPIGDIVAADAATRAAAAGAERWIEHYRRVASETLSEPELDSLLRAALASIARLLRADAVSLLLANEEGTALIGRAAFGLTREIDTAVTIPAGAGVSGPVLSTGQPRFIDDLTEVDVVSNVLPASGQRSYVGVPLTSGGRSLGVLHATRARVAPFAESDAELLLHFAAPLAAAIERVRLFALEQAARRDAEEAFAAAHRSAERVRGLQAITAALAGTATVEDICQIVIAHVVPDGADIEERAVWLVRDDRLVLVAGAGASGTFPDIGLEESMPATEALKSRDPLFVESRDEIVRRWPQLAHVPTTAFAALPLIAQGVELGVLGIGLRDRHLYEESEREYLIAVAEQTAVALARAEAQAALEEAWRVAEARRAQLDFLAEASDRFSRSLDLEVTMQTVATLAVPRLTDRCAVYLVDPLDATTVEKRVLGVQLSEDESLLFERSGATVTTLGAVGEVIQTGTKQHIEDLSEPLLAAAASSPEHLELLERVGFGGILLLPLRSRGRIIGSLALVNRRGRPMDQETVALAGELAARAAVAIDNAQVYGREAHVARQLVDSLLPPRLPKVAGLDVAVHFQPGSQGLEVGGDFYDMSILDEDRCLVVIGDVQGKGVEAAAVTGLARTTVRTAARFEWSPAALLGHLNAALVQNLFDRAVDEAHPWDDAKLCTAAVVRFDRGAAGRWQVSVASAGHPLPLLRHADGGVEPLGRPAILLGVEWEPSYSDSITDIGPGDALVLFTDGVTDCDAGSGPFGAEGVAHVLAESPAPTAEELTSRLAGAALRGVSVHDDVVVLTIAVTPEA